MNLFRRIDDFAFARIFQPIVNRFPDAGPAGVARFFVTGCLFTTTARCVPENHYTSLAISLICLTLVYLIADWPKARLGMRNARRVTELWYRAFSWFCTAVCLIWTPTDTPIKYGLAIADSVLFLSYWYAVACDKLPPPRAQSLIAPIAASGYRKRMPSPSSATFWSLIDRWGITDEQALELVSYEGKLPTTGTRSRFKLSPEQARIVTALLEIDSALTNAGLGAAWLKRKDRSTGRTPLDLMRAGAMDQVLRLITAAMLRASVKQRKPAAK